MTETKTGKRKSKRSTAIDYTRTQEYCSECGTRLEYRDWNTVGMVGICDSGTCGKYRQPQGWQGY